VHTFKHLGLHRSGKVLFVVFYVAGITSNPISRFSGVRDAVLMCDKTGCRRRGKFCFFYIHKKVARICFSIVELRKKNVTREVAKLGD